MVDFPLRKIQAVIFVKKFRLEVFVAESVPENTAYTVHIITVYATLHGLLLRSFSECHRDQWVYE